MRSSSRPASTRDPWRISRLRQSTSRSRRAGNGTHKSGINEIIATTAKNAAPIGIHYRDGKATMILFGGSHTAANIERDGWVVANIVHDPVLYVKTAFEDLPDDAFVEEPVGNRIMYRLAGAEAWIAFSATVEKKTGEAIVVALTEEKRDHRRRCDPSGEPGIQQHHRCYRACYPVPGKPHTKTPAPDRLPFRYREKVRREKELAALSLLEGYIGQH